ncbi:MAG: hypothetical protein R3B67_05080 [Phycisphaerales bacterium]
MFSIAAGGVKADIAVGFVVLHIVWSPMFARSGAEDLSVLLDFEQRGAVRSRDPQRHDIGGVDLQPVVGESDFVIVGRHEDAGDVCVYVVKKETILCAYCSVWPSCQRWNRVLNSIAVMVSAVLSICRMGVNAGALAATEIGSSRRDR